MDMHPGVLRYFWSLKVRGTIHAGAHKGEEAGTYLKYGFGPVTWIEAIPELARDLEARTHPPDRVINATLWKTSGEPKIFTIMTSSGSSSLFQLGTHLVEYPKIQPDKWIEVLTSARDDLDLSDKENLLVLDLQGAEYQALEGSGKTLTRIDYILSEVSRKQLYQGIRLIPEIDKLLYDFRFIRVATRWTRHGWGEALYISTRLLPKGGESSLGLIIKKVTYWVWSHLVEIPVVYFRKVFPRLR